MRKTLLLLTIALFLLSGCGRTVSVTDINGLGDSAADGSAEADVIPTPVPTPTPWPEIPYEDYSEDLFADTIVAPDELVTELPDASNDANLEYYNGVYFHKNLPQSTRNAFFSYYEMEPLEVRQAMDEYGVIVIVDNNGAYTGGHAGLYYAEEKILAINGSSVSKIAMSINHEIGHCVDTIVGELVGMPIDETIYWLGISNTEEYVDIFLDEYQDAGYPSWNSNSNFEFFAETYRYVIEGNDTMTDRAPESAAYVRRIINQYFSDHTNLIFPDNYSNERAVTDENGPDEQ